MKLVCWHGHAWDNETYDWIKKLRYLRGQFGTRFDKRYTSKHIGQSGARHGNNFYLCIIKLICHPSCCGLLCSLQQLNIKLYFKNFLDGSLMGSSCYSSGLTNKVTVQTNTEEDCLIRFQTIGWLTKPQFRFTNLCELKGK